MLLDSQKMMALSNMWNTLVLLWCSLIIIEFKSILGVPCDKRHTLHALEGGIKYLEIIVLGFINTSKGKKKNIIEKICLLRHSVELEKHQWLKNSGKKTVIKTKNYSVISEPN